MVNQPLVVCVAAFIHWACGLVSMAVIETLGIARPSCRGSSRQPNQHSSRAWYDGFARVSSMGAFRLPTAPAARRASEAFVTALITVAVGAAYWHIPIGKKRGADLSEKKK